ncbi:TAXI family TRAP transporter solute-binding subunit [Micromonospora sp. STR1s_5]|nr:TAXI family TRAP transporter solute-binding subunit [Micromonospora sp. STR1s_5]
MHSDRRRVIGGTCAMGAAAVLTSGHRASAQPVKVVLGTATPGGGFPVYGAAVIEALKKADADLVVEARNTKGSTENGPMLERGELDLGLVTGEVAYEAFAGIGRPPASLKVLTAMYSQPGMFVVRADSPARRIEDLRGKPVAFGARGSGLVVLARYVLDGMGLSTERDFEAIYLDRAGDGPAMVLDGRVAARLGRRPGLAGVHECRLGAGRRAIHRAGAGRDGHDPAQAPLPEAPACSGQELSGPGRPDRIAGLVELHPGTLGSR